MSSDRPNVLSNAIGCGSRKLILILKNEIKSYSFKSNIIMLMFLVCYLASWRFSINKCGCFTSLSSWCNTITLLEHNINITKATMLSEFTSLKQIIWTSLKQIPWLIDGGAAVKCSWCRSKSLCSACGPLFCMTLFAKTGSSWNWNINSNHATSKPIN